MTDTGITITRTFAAPRELVYDAWLTPEHFAAWFGGSNGEIPLETVSMDATVGGAWKATMFAGPERYEISWKGTYLELERPSRIRMTLTDVDEEGEGLTVTFAEVTGGTEMTFHQSGGNLTDEQYSQAAAGWQTFFDALATIVEA